MHLSTFSDRPCGAAPLNVLRRASLLWIAGACLAALATAAHAQTISTIAGTGASGFGGDGGPATAAPLDYPGGVAKDSAGNIYIADTDNRRIRKIAPNGIISTVAGNGVSPAGTRGDGGLATDAQLNDPTGVAVDSSGNIFIADPADHRIRKVSTDGTISTVAGTGTPGFGGDGGPATAAQLWAPRDVAVDSAGHLFIADFSNHRVRRIDTDGSISTVAGDGTAGFNSDGIPAMAARLNYPNGVALDTAGSLFIADKENHRVRKVAMDGSTISTVVGSGTAGFGGDGGSASAALLNSPTGVALDNAGNLFVVDHLNERIRKINLSTGTITTVAGAGTCGFSGDGGPATEAEFCGSNGMAVDSRGNLYITDPANNRIRMVAAPVPYASAVQPVPTLSQWALVGLALLLGLAGTHLRRRI